MERFRQVRTLVSPGADAWDLSLAEFATGALLQTLGMMGAFAFGLALMSSAPAIVLAYVLPIVFAILAETIPGFRDTADWLDTTAPSEALWTDTGDGTAWGQLATAWARVARRAARDRAGTAAAGGAGLDGRPVEVGEGRRQAAEALLDDGDDPPADLAGGLPVEDRGTERLVAQLQRCADHDRERADRRVVGIAAELAREGAAERLAGLVPDQRAPRAERGRPVLRLLEAAEHLERSGISRARHGGGSPIGTMYSVSRARRAPSTVTPGGRSVTVDSNRACTSSSHVEDERFLGGEVVEDGLHGDIRPSPRSRDLDVLEAARDEQPRGDVRDLAGG